jgi:hypothetical protein
MTITSNRVEAIHMPLMILAIDVFSSFLSVILKDGST